MAIVKGKNFMLSFKRDGVNVPVCYAENVSITLNSELLEATKPTTSNWRNFYPGLLDYSIDCNGVVFDDENSTYNIASMQDILVNRQSVDWIAQDVTNPLKYYSGTVYFPSITEDSAAADINRFTVSGRGDGEFVITYIIPGDTGNVFYGTQDNSDDPTDFTNFVQTDANRDIIITYGSGLDGLFFWVSYSKGAQNKTAWMDMFNTMNNGSIGGANDLFDTREIEIEGSPFWLHMTRYETGFAGSQATVKFYIPPLLPGGALPPTAFTATFSIVDDTSANIAYDFTAPLVGQPADGFEIRLIDVTASTTSITDIGTDTSGTIGAVRGHDYVVSVRSYNDFGASIWIGNVSLKIPAASDIETIFFTIGVTNTGILYLLVNASGVVNTPVTITYEGGTFGNRVQSTIVINAGSSSASKNFTPTTDQGPVIISLSPTTFGNQQYTF